VLLALLVAVLAVVAAGRQVLASTPSGAPAPNPHGPPITVVVPSGATAADIASILEQRGVIADASRFHDYTDSQGEGSKFQAGTYAFRAGLGYDALMEALDAGPLAHAKRLTIPEGYRITQIQALLPSVGINPKAYGAAVRAAVPPPGFGHHANMEGFMFPATYMIRPGETAAQLVQQQLAAFSGAWSQVDMSYAKSKNLTPYDVLKIASMIEREATAPGDRAKVSAVIYNRLHRNMALGIDATIRYYLGTWTGPIHQSDLDNPEPYNNRIHKGLPPTPICNPGLASMQAAAKPGPYDYLYYVAQPGKTEQYFTSSYTDFVNHGG
jgi:UPF0755 protein